MNSMNESLIEAIKNSDKTKILSLLNIDSTANEDEDANTVLHHILKNEKLTENTITDILKIFLDDSIEVNTENYRWETPLHIAVANRMKSAVDLLIKHNATINIDGRSFITHYFINDERKKFWEMPDTNDKQAILNREKMENESANFVEWMILKGFDFHQKCEKGFSALNLAEKHFLLHIIPVILKYTKNIKCVKYEGQCLFNGILLENGWGQLDDPSELTKSWFIGYRLRHATNIVKILLEAGVSTDEEERIALLSLASWSEEPSIIEMVVNHFPKGCDEKFLAMIMFNHLLTRHTKLMRTEFYFKILNNLIKGGADVNYQDKVGRRPVYWAVLGKNLRAVEILKTNGADFKVLPENRQNLLHILAEKDIKQVGCEEAEETIFDLLVGEGCDVNAKNIRGYSPLHIAAKCGNMTVVWKLIDYGAIIDCKNDDLRTPLHCASMEYQASEIVIDCLLDEGAAIDKKDFEGRTPLHLAASVKRQKGNLAVIRLLLSRGAYLDIHDNEGNTPLAITIRCNNAVNAKELLEHGANANNPNIFKNFPSSFWYPPEVTVLMVQHRHKLKAAKLPCVGYDRKFNYCKGARQEYYEKCLQEVEILKDTFIDKQISIYDWLHMDLHARFIYINNEKLMDIVDCPKIEERFPKYSTLILGCYRVSVTRLELLGPAKEAWFELTEIRLPDICIETVFKFLSNEDLVIIIKKDSNLQSSPLKE